MQQCQHNIVLENMIKKTAASFIVSTHFESLSEVYNTQGKHAVLELLGNNTYYLNYLLRKIRNNVKS